MRVRGLESLDFGLDSVGVLRFFMGEGNSTV